MVRKSARCVVQRVRRASLLFFCAIITSTGAIAGDSYYGTASWYNKGEITASGKVFKPDKYSVAHRTLPFGTMLRLTNVKNGTSIDAIVSDRGLFVRTKELDVSSGAAKALGFFHSGTAKLLIEVLDGRK